MRYVIAIHISENIECLSLPSACSLPTPFPSGAFLLFPCFYLLSVFACISMYYNIHLFIYLDSVYLHLRKNIKYLSFWV